MSDDAIASLAAATGAKRAPELGPNEIVEFVIGANGTLVVTTASGHSHEVARLADIPEHDRSKGTLTAEGLLLLLVPDFLKRYSTAEAIPVGTVFLRRHRWVCGEAILEFCEAGR